jgi:UTP--glucose-1-phosphate uridylyltransferase
VPVTDAVIPVAGLGTRLLPATRSQPKEMLPVLDKPVVQYVVEELVANGITRVLFVTGRRKRAIEDHFDADPELGSAPLIDPRTGLQILYTRQASPAGLGDAIRYGTGLADGRGLVVALGDAIIEPAPGVTGAGLVARLIEAYEAGGVCAAVAVQRVPESAVSRYGIVVGETREDGLIEVSAVVEKPDPEQVSSRMAVAARYVVGPSVLAELQNTEPDASGEIQLADAFTTLLARGERIVALALADGEHRHDIGNVRSYSSTFLRYALRDPRFGSELRAELAALLTQMDGDG